MLDYTGKIKGNYTIMQQDGYVIAYGKALYILRTDGSLVAQRKNIAHVQKAAFLSNERLVIEAHTGYHLISLRDGSDIWKFNRTGRMEFCAKRFAISSDESFVYDCYSGRWGYYWAVIDMESAKISHYPLRCGFRVTVDMKCGANDTLCLLQTQSDMIAGKPVQQSGILFRERNDCNWEKGYDWKSKWQTEGTHGPMSFLGNTDTVLTDDLYVYSPATGMCFDLLENGGRAALQADRHGNPHRAWRDATGNYLCLMCDDYNLIVDIQARKVVAKYAGYFRKGCVIGEEFWISSDSGIRRAKFPIIEENIPKISEQKAAGIFLDW